jgi:hypothetical protein
MKNMFKQAILTGAAAVLCLGAHQLVAQAPDQPQPRQGGGGRGNFDPAQMQQRMMDNYKEQLEFTSDDEWNAVKPLIQKVLDARRDVGFGGMGRGGMFGMGRRGGDNPPAGDQAQNAQRRRFGAEPSQAQQDLQKAIEAKASADEIKTKLAKVRDDRKQKEAVLTKAQEDLKKVLNARREAQAVMAGLLN